MHAAVCDFIVDCVQNSIEAGASDIVLEVGQSERSIQMIIRDDGCGMTETELRKAQDPFYTDGKKHVHRRVGLGLPFLIQALELSGGSFEMESEKGKGTLLKFTFDLKHIDSPPLGRLDDTFLQIFLFSGDHELTIKRKIQFDDFEDEWELKRLELIGILGSLEDGESLILAREFIRNQEESIRKQET